MQPPPPMKKLISCILLLWVMGSLHAQKHDFRWLFGYANKYIGVDSFRGGVNLDFNYSPAKIYAHTRLADFDQSNMSFCDREGILFMYSNGTDVFDSRDSVMLKGDT